MTPKVQLYPGCLRFISKEKGLSLESCIHGVYYDVDKEQQWAINIINPQMISSSMMHSASPPPSTHTHIFFHYRIRKGDCKPKENLWRYNKT